MNHNYQSLKSDVNTEDLSRFAFKSAGLLLLMRGIRSRGLIGVGLAAGGLSMLFPETASKIVGRVWPSNCGHRPQGRPEGAPSFRDERHIPAQQPVDEVEEAAMASFPASDPPSSYRSS